MIRKCQNCDNEIKISVSEVLRGRGNYCSNDCKYEVRSVIWAGEKGPNWKGGEYTNDQGYIMIRKPNHPKATSNGYIRKHRMIMENFLGRILASDEIVHHINGDLKDNSIKNLQVISQSFHMSQHYKEREINSKGQFV